MMQTTEFEEDDLLWDKAEEAIEREDFAGLLSVWKSLADKGVWQIYAAIGGLFERGAIGVPRDLQQALYWYKKAVDEGDDQKANVRLGLAFLNGAGIRQNPVAARDHFERAYAQGSAGAALYLGWLYYAYDDEIHDLARAKICLETAALAEYFYAYGLLARIALNERKFVKAIGLTIKGFLIAWRIKGRTPDDDPRLLGIQYPERKGK